VANSVYAKVDRMRQALRQGYHLDVRLDQTRFIHESVRELKYYRATVFVPDPGPTSEEAAAAAAALAEG
jgi:multidrug efflux pump subunit AcrB